MLDLVCYVREISPFGLQLCDVFERTLQPQVGLMRADAQTVEHQYFQIAQAFNGCRRNLAEIRRVSKIVEPVGDDRQAPMDNFERSDFQVTCETESGARNYGMRHYLRQASAEMSRLKNVLKNPPDAIP